MPPLSRRGAKLADHSPFAEYMLVSREHLDRRWSPERPDGFIDLSVAENCLVWDLLREPLSAARQVPLPASRYGDSRGHPAFRHSVAALASRTFLGRSIDPDSIYALAGAGAVLEALFYALCDPGDGVLVAAPGYPGFWMDLEQRDGVVIVPVETLWEDGFAISIEALDRAYETADRPIRALLVASPDNPTGRVLPAAEVGALVDWCRSRGIHVVFDEVYALSVHDGSVFTSVASIRELDDDVHVIWAVSKDFAVSGLRCGVLITESERIGQAMASQAIWSGVSGRTQHLFSELLADDQWVDGYLAEMPRRLATSHMMTLEGLAQAGIGSLPGQAGFFLMADFRSFLTEQSFAAEQALWRRIVDSGVNTTPGSACRSATPGFARICFAAVPREALELGLSRIGAALR
jgi:aspartate/methionine/tyrosine aminotransferase